MLRRLSVIKPNWQLVLLGVILVLLVMYVQQTNNQASQSFDIRRLELTRADLNEQIRQLTWEIGSARSLATIQDRARLLSLSAPSDVSFVKGSFSTVAVATGP
ncbi:MAG: hypothetical protein Q8L21_03505 [Candidatus Komeilibacteria bacterium]|nr:hypothetical protein [Candidatus Komeilibacteria bacterium]